MRGLSVGPRRMAAMLLVVLGSALAAAACGSGPDDCAGHEAGCTEARSSRSFIDSVGVNTHLGYNSTPYLLAWPLVRDRLAELGVKHIRDASYPDGTRLPDVVVNMQELDRMGIKGDLLSGNPQLRFGSGTVDQHLAWVRKNVPSFTESLEGPNEYDNPAADPRWQQTLRSYQCDWAHKIRNDSALAGKTVIGPAPGGVGFATLGDLSSCLDVGNVHPYPGARPPDQTNAGAVSLQLAGARRVSGSKPLWITESGYHNAIACVCGHAPVSERASGIYIPRMFMENFRLGVDRTYAYELIDEHADPRRVDPQSNFGLLRQDGTPKPAFTTMRNLLRILADKDSDSGKLAYSVRCAAACSVPLRHVLLRKSTGDYYIVVWPQSSVWNPQTRKDTHHKLPSADLRILSPPGRLELFDPARSDVARNLGISTHHRFALTDGMLVFKFTPPAG